MINFRCFFVLDCFARTILFWLFWSVKSVFRKFSYAKLFAWKKSLINFLAWNKFWYILNLTFFLKNIFMRSYINEGLWLYIVSIASSVPHLQTEASNKFHGNKIISLLLLINISNRFWGKSCRDRIWRTSIFI